MYNKMSSPVPTPPAAPPAPPVIPPPPPVVVPAPPAIPTTPSPPDASAPAPATTATTTASTSYLQTAENDITGAYNDIQSSSTSTTVWVLIIIWLLAGLICFIWSLVCFSADKSGTTGNKAVGTAIALLLGPFYWIYYYVNKSYCRQVQPNSGWRWGGRKGGRSRK